MKTSRESFALVSHPSFGLSVKLFKTAMESFGIKDFRFFSFVMLVFLISAPHLFGFQKASIPKDNGNQLPPLSLIGVVLSEDSGASVAVILDRDAGKTVVLSVGESVLEMELTHVFEDGIVLNKGKKIYWLLLKSSPQSISEKNIDADPKRTGKVGKEIDESRNIQAREFVRSEIMERIERQRAVIINETNVVPNYVDGKIDGFKVINLPRRGIAAEVGIRADDVIKEINGVKLNKISALLMLYRKISEEERYEVLIERDKKLIRQVYILK